MDLAFKVLTIADGSGKPQQQYRPFFCPIAEHQTTDVKTNVKNLMDTSAHKSQSTQEEAHAHL